MGKSKRKPVHIQGIVSDSAVTSGKVRRNSGQPSRLPVRHRRRDDDESHWLGEGITGQDSLLFDLDPYVYLVDGFVAKVFSQTAYHYNGDNARALSVVFSPPDFVPWQISYFRTRSDVALCAPEFDPILDEAGSRFDLSVFFGAIPARLTGEADFVFFAGSRWESVDSFALALETTYETLIEGGTAVFIFRGLQRESANDLAESDTETLVEFVDQTSITVDDLLREIRSERFHRLERHLVSFREVRGVSDYGAGEFAKRHRKFFGASARDLCLARLYEEEFQKLLVDENNRCAVVLVLGDPQ